MSFELFFVVAVVWLLSHWLTKQLCSPPSSLYLLDQPNERSLHTQPKPRTGGLAIMLSLGIGSVLSVLASQLLGKGLVPFWSPKGTGAGLWIIAFAFLISTISFWDDKAGLPSGIRFGFHCLAALAAVWAAGLVIHDITLPLFGKFALGWMAAPLTVLFLIWMANLYNFMDGMDGFAGGMSVVGFGFLGLIAWMNGHIEIAWLSILILSASAGFLLHNLPPARIFMGDAGSVPLGFMAGSLALLGVRDGVFDMWVPILIFSPFIVDATITLVQRLLRGEKVWQAHRHHYYQRLALTGWGHRKTMLMEYLLMLSSGASALLYLRISEPWRLILLLSWVLIYCLLAWAARRFESRSAVQQRKQAWNSF